MLFDVCYPALALCNQIPYINLTMNKIDIIIDLLEPETIQYLNPLLLLPSPLSPVVFPSHHSQLLLPLFFPLKNRTS